MTEAATVQPDTFTQVPVEAFKSEYPRTLNALSLTGVSIDFVDTLQESAASHAADSRKPGDKVEVGEALLDTTGISIGKDVFGQSLVKAKLALDKARGIRPDSRVKSNVKLNVKIEEEALADELWEARFNMRCFANAPKDPVFEHFMGKMTGIVGVNMPQDLKTAYQEWKQTSPAAESRVIDWVANEASNDQLINFSKWYGERFEKLYAAPEVIQHIAASRANWARRVEVRQAEGWYGNIDPIEAIKQREVEIVDPIGVGMVYGESGMHSLVAGFVKLEHARILGNTVVGGVKRKFATNQHGKVIHLPASSVSNVKSNIDWALYHEGDHTLGGLHVTWLDEALTEHDSASQKHGQDNIIDPSRRSDSGAYEGYRKLLAGVVDDYNIPPKLLMRAKTDKFLTSDNSRALFEHLKQQGAPEALEIISVLVEYYKQNATLSSGEDSIAVGDRIAGELAERMRDPEVRSKEMELGAQQLAHLKKVAPNMVPRIK